MAATRGARTRTTFITIATDLIRRHGYTATTVDEICARAGLTKGAFFHHFKSKDDLVRACLSEWDEGAAALEARAPFQQAIDPRDRVLGYMDLYIALFDDPQMVKSCLAGTTVQEVADTNAELRTAANICFVNALGRLSALLDAAFRGRRPRVPTSALATLWMATVQGSLILAKAAQDARVIRTNLQQVRQYIASHLPMSVQKGSKRS